MFNFCDFVILFRFMYLPQITTLKYGIYEPQEVEYPKKKLVRKCTRFFIGVQPSSVYKSHIINGPINKLYKLLSENRKLAYSCEYYFIYLKKGTFDWRIKFIIHMLKYST